MRDPAERVATTRVLGYPPGWLRGRSFLDVVHPNDRVAFTRALRGQLAAPKIAAVGLRARLRHYDGGWRPIQATGANLLDEPSVRSLVLSVRDVTASAQVETQQRRLAKIVDATSDLVATVEPDGYLIDLNPAGRALLGVDAEADITGLNLADFAADELEAGAIAAAMVAAAFDGTWRGEATLRARDGRVIPTLAVIVGQCDDTSDIEDFSAILPDITERKRLEDELAHQAFHDALTGLANRALLLDRLGHALDRGDRGLERRRAAHRPR
ncbi:MAG: PAS domain S-box protein [Mycobacterium leprae]